MVWFPFEAKGASSVLLLLQSRSSDQETLPIGNRQCHDFVKLHTDYIWCFSLVLKRAGIKHTMSRDVLALVCMLPNNARGFGLAFFHGWAMLSGTG
jgi:hypothetical protein